MAIMGKMTNEELLAQRLARDVVEAAFGAGVVAEESGAVVAVAGAAMRALVDHGLGVLGAGVAGLGALLAAVRHLAHQQGAGGAVGDHGENDE